MVLELPIRPLLVAWGILGGLGGGAAWGEPEPQEILGALGVALALDREVDALLQRNTPPFARSLARGVGRAASPATLGLVALAGQGVSRGPEQRLWRQTTFALGTTLALTGLGKVLLGRERPPPEGGRLGGWGRTHRLDASFPSGHTAAAFTMAGVLSVHHPRQRSLWVGLATWVGLSRLVEREHFLSDVVAGAALGWAIGTATARHDRGLLEVRW